MTSLLFIPPLATFSPSEAVAVKSAELDVHNAAMATIDEVRDAMPPEMRDHVYPAAVTGLTSAIGRILALAPNQDGAHQTIFRFSRMMAAEHRYWLNRRVLLH